MENRIFYFVTFVILVSIISMNITFAEILQESQERCEESGGKWVSEERCKPLPDGTEYCTLFQECQCPEGFSLMGCSVCIKPLEEGTPPVTQEKCEGGGGNWGIIRRDRITGEVEYGCRCELGYYFSKESRCIEIPKEFLCESTCGVFVNNTCICPDTQKFVEKVGCTAKMEDIGEPGEVEEAEEPTLSELPEKEGISKGISIYWIIAITIIITLIIATILILKKEK